MESQALHHNSEIIEPSPTVLRDHVKDNNEALSPSLPECYKWRLFRKPEVYPHPIVARSPCFPCQWQPGSEPRLPLPPDSNEAVLASFAKEVPGEVSKNK